ncbi:MAG: FxDxF family PEP-CTERM protein [Chitinivorax sp.]
MMHLSKKLLAAAVAVSLTGIAGIANAKKFDVDLGTPFEDLVSHKSKPNNDSFVDKFNFTLSNDATLSVQLAELTSFNTKLSLLDLDLFKVGAGTTSLVFDLPVMTDSDPAIEASFTTGVLTAGSYYLRVSGDIAKRFGAYSIGMTALNSGTTPPVPEPSEYLMLLAGLGVVGYAVRRKNAAN